MIELSFKGTLEEAQAIFAFARDAQVLARLDEILTLQGELKMDATQATALLNAANAKLDTANANTQTAITALVKIKGETSGLVDAVAALKALVEQGQTLSPEFTAALDALSAKTDSIVESTSGIVVGATEVDALVPDAPTAPDTPV